MSRDTNTISQIAGHDTRMGHFLHKIKQACDNDNLSLCSFITRLETIANLTNAVGTLAGREYDRIIGTMNPVDVNVWFDEHNFVNLSANNAWLELTNMDLAMDDEAYDAHDALWHMTTIRRVFRNGPEVYHAVQQAAAIGNHDSVYFTDVTPSALNDMVNRVWNDAGREHEPKRLMLEKHIFSTMMEDFQTGNDKTVNEMLLQISDKELNGFISRLRNRFH